MDYNYEDTSTGPLPLQPESQPQSQPDSTPIVVPTPVSTTSSSAVGASVTVTPKKELPLKPFEAVTLVLVAIALIWCGMGMKHVKKPIVAPAHKVIAVVNKVTPKPTVKTVIKAKPAVVKPTVEQKPTRRISHKRTVQHGSVDEVLGR